MRARGKSACARCARWSGGGLRVFLRHERCYGGALSSSARRSLGAALSPNCQTPKIKIAWPDFYHQEVLYVVLFTSPVSCETLAENSFFIDPWSRSFRPRCARVCVCICGAAARSPPGSRRVPTDFFGAPDTTVDREPISLQGRRSAAPLYRDFLLPSTVGGDGRRRGAAQSAAGLEAHGMQRRGRSQACSSARPSSTRCPSGTATFG